MNELARKRPANLPVRGQSGYLEAPTARGLLREVQRRTAAGELAEVGPIRWDSASQGWRCDVRLVIGPRRRFGWRAVLLIVAGAILAAGILLWLLVKLVSALVGLVVALVPVIVLVLIIGSAGRGGSINVIQRVTIK